MMSQARQRLLDDHDAVGEVLKELLTALDNNDVQTSYAKLDLLWARLAVHIRAEHLHLFPTVTSRLTGTVVGGLPGLSEAEALITDLRADHDFFMRGLARLIALLREPGMDLAAIADAVRGIEKRLATHNASEENGIYRWATMVLSDTEQTQLLARINAELENRPPRFSAEAWKSGLP